MLPERGLSLLIYGSSSPGQRRVWDTVGGKIKLSDTGPTEWRPQRGSWCRGRKGSSGLFGCE